MSSKLKIKWKTKFFGDCAELIKDTCKPNKDELTPYVGLEHIEQNTLQLNGLGNSSEIISNKYKFCKGDILFGKLRPYFRKVICPDFNGICSTDIFVVRSKLGIDQKFLYFWMASQEFVNQATQSSTGTKMPRADWDSLCEIEKELPDIEEQEKISNILWGLQQSIINLNEQNKNLEKTLQSIFKSWFVNFEFPNENGKNYQSSGSEMSHNDKLRQDIPKKWNVVKIGTKLITKSGSTPSRKNNSFWDHGVVNWINSSKVNDFRIVKPYELISEEAKNNSSTKLIPKDTTVIAITGSTMGEVSFLEIDSCISQNVVAILNNPSMSSEFIYFWIKHTIPEILSSQSGGAQQHINKTVVDDSYLLIPDDDILEKFDNIAKPIFEKISLNCFQLLDLIKIRDFLLPKLMSGEVRL